MNEPSERDTAVADQPVAPPPARHEEPRGTIAEWTVTILLLLFGTTTLVQAFVIPTGSMEDTLLIGDHLLVDKLAYAPVGSVSKHLLPYEDVHRGDIIVFLDDDAIAQPGWLSALMRPYGDPNVIGVGGRAEPGWATRRPPWWPGEFDWVVGCTYTGMEPGTVRNLQGCNSSYRRDLFEIGGFASHIGRSARHRLPLAAEEAEFCIRAVKARPRGVFVYDDQALMVHRVPPARQSFSYFRTRCLSEGLSKALVTKSVGVGAGLATERRYSTVTLPVGMLRGLRRGARGDWAGLLRAGAIIVGLMYTTLGYGLGLVLQIIHRGGHGDR